MAQAPKDGKPIEQDFAEYGAVDDAASGQSGQPPRKPAKITEVASKLEVW